MTQQDDLLDSFGDPKYVLLTTFRKLRDGETEPRSVATPVWITRDGGELLVTTHGQLGKAKRMRGTPRVTLQACNMRGVVAPDAPLYVGEARVLSDPDSLARLRRVVRGKYGFLYRLTLQLAKLQKSAGPEVAVVIRLVA